MSQLCNHSCFVILFSLNNLVPKSTDHIFFYLFPTLVGAVQSRPSTNTYLSSASAVGDKVVSNDAEDNVAKVDVASLPYLWKFSQYFWISA